MKLHELRSIEWLLHTAGLESAAWAPGPSTGDAMLHKLRDLAQTLGLGFLTYNM